MADNSTQTGADTIATDDVTTLNGAGSSGIKVQRVKVGYGDDASYRDASAAFPLPVDTNALQHTTYTAVLDNVATGALTANTRKDVLSLEHSAASTKTVRVRQIVVSGFQTTSLAGVDYFKLFRGTAATTAGSAVTPAPTNPASAAAEVVAKSLPTITAATLLWTVSVANLAATANTGFQGVALYQWWDSSQEEPLILRAGVLDTLVLAAYSSVAHNLTLQATVVLTEE